MSLDAPVDMLVVAAHPDDEVATFGAIIPHSLTRGRSVAVACLTRQADMDLATVRESELRASLLVCGLHHEPVLGSFPDCGFIESGRFESLTWVWERWGGRDAAKDYIASLYRRFRPQVVFSHHPETGEYGHPNHMAAGDPATPCKIYARSDAPDAWHVDWHAVVGQAITGNVAFTRRGRQVNRGTCENLYVAAKPRTQCRIKDHGFTLIELLVVVAIIAALAGLLVHGIILVRERAFRLKAVEQVAQLHWAIQNYASEERRHRFPPQTAVADFTLRYDPANAVPGNLNLLISADHQMDLTALARNSPPPFALMDPWRRPYQYQVDADLIAFAVPQRPLDLPAWNVKGTRPWGYLWSAGPKGTADGTGWIYARDDR